MFIEHTEIKIPRALSGECLHLEFSSNTQRREEAHRPEVRALRNARIKGPRESPEGVIFRSASGGRRPKTRMVAFGYATEKVAGFLASPQRRHRTIIAIHEWWDLNEWGERTS